MLERNTEEFRIQSKIEKWFGFEESLADRITYSDSSRHFSHIIDLTVYIQN